MSFGRSQNNLCVIYLSEKGLQLCKGVAAVRLIAPWSPYSSMGRYSGELGFCLPSDWIQQSKPVMLEC